LYTYPVSLGTHLSIEQCSRPFLVIRFARKTNMSAILPNTSTSHKRPIIHNEFTFIQASRVDNTNRTQLNEDSKLSECWAVSRSYVHQSSDYTIVLSWPTRMRCNPAHISRNLCKPDTSIHGGRVISTLGCNARGHGFAAQNRRYFWDLFSWIDTVSGTEGLKMVCVTLWNLMQCDLQYLRC